jgi:hypothetical protein
MEKTKVQIFKAKTPEELESFYNNNQESFISSQIFRESNEWVMFAYYKSQSTIDKASGGKSPSPPNPATEKQLDYIYKNHLDVNTENLTKSEAFKIIKEHKERR